jgi:hypothetical protein
VDVDLVRAIVDLWFDGFSAKKRISRNQTPSFSAEEKSQRRKHEKLRSVLTYGIGGMLEKQVPAPGFYMLPHASTCFYMLLRRTVPTEPSVNWGTSSGT